MVLVVRYVVLFMALAGHIHAAGDMFTESRVVVRFANSYYDSTIKKKNFTEIDDENTSNSGRNYLIDRLDIGNKTKEEFTTENVDNIRSNSPLDSDITEVLADITGRAIRANFDQAVNGTFIYLYARNTGEFLQINGVLTKKNLERLVRKAIRSEIEAIEKSSSGREDFKATLAETSIGFHDFIVDQGLGDRELYAVLVTLYADNFYSIADGQEAVKDGNHPPFRESDVAVRFSNMYSDQVMKDEQLSEAFKIDDVTTEQAANITEQKVRENGKDSDLIEKLAELVRLAVNQNYPRATDQTITQFYGISVAEQLQLFGDLTSDTTTDKVQDLVDQCIQAQRDAIGNTTGVSPEEVMGRVIQGLMDFLSDMEDLTKDKFPSFVTLYSKVYYRFP